MPANPSLYALAFTHIRHSVSLPQARRPPHFLTGAFPPPTLLPSRRALDTSGNGADQLRYLFIVSQTEILDTPGPARLCPFSEAFGTGEDAATAADAPAAAAATAGADAAPAAAGTAGAAGEFVVGVLRAGGAKCARCWNYCESVGVAGGAAHAGLCERCVPVVEELGFVPAPAEVASVGA
eukprot:365258-Chlamydomonas_euryale.AAC.2